MQNFVPIIGKAGCKMLFPQISVNVLLPFSREMPANVTVQVKINNPGMRIVIEYNYFVKVSVNETLETIHL